MAHVTASLSRVHPQLVSPAVVINPKPAPKTASAAPPSFRALFSSASPAATPAAAPAPPASSAPPPAAAPTAESVFGANPWETNPVGKNPNGSLVSYNPIYFASASTAGQVAQMLGGTVTQSNALSSSAQQQPNYMVQLPNGHTINPGLVAAFYTHGYPQSYIDGMIANDVATAT